MLLLHHAGSPLLLLLLLLVLLQRVHLVVGVIAQPVRVLLLVLEVGLRGRGRLRNAANAELRLGTGHDVDGGVVDMGRLLLLPHL